MSKLRKLVIGDLIVDRPIVQGGMGVGVSLSSLAGAVAAQGGIGLISTAQIGFRESDFDKAPFQANMRAIVKELERAREIAEKTKAAVGAIGFNIMVATKGYEDYVKTAVKHGADIIVSGAGLPLNLPALVKEGMELRKGLSPSQIFGDAIRRTKFAPIVSSKKSAEVILKMWDRKQKTTADAVVIEGPLAGGHLGFSLEELHTYGADTKDVSKTYRRDLFDQEVRGILGVVADYAKKYVKKIPVILAGGIYDHSDVAHAMELGVDGVQVGTRFVTSFECDAPQSYKDAYIAAKEENIQITKSPVGMPGRAIENSFLEEVKKQRKPVTKCHFCLEKCDRATIPYCITDSLINAVTEDTPNALLFCGANAYRAKKLETVKEIIEDLSKGFEEQDEK